MRTSKLISREATGSKSLSHPRIRIRAYSKLTSSGRFEISFLDELEANQGRSYFFLVRVARRPNARDEQKKTLEEGFFVLHRDAWTTRSSKARGYRREGSNHRTPRGYGKGAAPTSPQSQAVRNRFALHSS